MQLHAFCFHYDILPFLLAVVESAASVVDHHLDSFLLIHRLVLAADFSRLLFLAMVGACSKFDHWERRLCSYLSVYAMVVDLRSLVVVEARLTRGPFIFDIFVGFVWLAALTLFPSFSLFRFLFLCSR